MQPIHLAATHIDVSVDPDAGARIASMCISGVEFLVPPTDDPLTWGCYPMAPYAGRVRNAQFRFNGKVHDLRANAEPHALHGTVYNRAWRVVERSEKSISMTISLGADWPMLGRATHTVSVTDTSVLCELRIEADEAMPAHIGWHPWFRSSAQVVTDFGAMLQRDPFGIATEKRVAVPNGAVDDCFIDSGEYPRVTINDVTIEIVSDCSHWVRFDSPEGTVCIEPQSGAPNQINDSPIVIAPGSPLVRRMEFRRL